MKRLIVLAVPALAGLAVLGSGSRAAPPQLVRAAPAAAVQAAPASIPAPPEAAVSPAVEEAAAPAPAPHAAPTTAIDSAVTEEAPVADPAPAAPVYCPKDGTVYTVGSCVLDPSVMPSGAAEGTPVKYCSGNFECPADYPDPGDGQPLTGCTTTDYHSCESYTPAP
jgi:hypothetical protein